MKGKDLFRKRLEFRPFEYPELIKYRDAIRLSRWHFEEFDFGEDIQDFHTKLSNKEKNCIKNTMLAISQVETENVKTYWAYIGETFPKPEVSIVGITFGENEIIHGDSYSELLNLLGFNDEFKRALKNPVLMNRVNYLNKYLNKRDINTKQFKLLKLTLFSLFVENVSLFGQFLIIKSFKEKKNLLKSLDNVVLSTQNDELVHAQFGIELINIVREESPELFDEDFERKLILACKKAYRAEEEIVDWIFEKGDLDFITAYDVKEFMKQRFNQSLNSIGYDSIFELDDTSLDKTNWFNEQIHGYIRNDFFVTKSRNYNKVNVTESNIISGVKKFKEDHVLV